ncbi:hypothetical protein HYDPIDRAFT_102650 [Hydnomerulius pinastri MD-312]|uniref:Uncharacterized protein n=1 Tax=Hydnomerulius pinastri MD-312 TaxID=994086 RepID=A0A0C9W6N5_9AGAM|nr:hypothetical protein HYDPIDRAFT_102650 [Hydnomerulius pinastri MD-312]
MAGWNTLQFGSIQHGPNAFSNGPLSDKTHEYRVPSPRLPSLPGVQQALTHAPSRSLSPEGIPSHPAVVPSASTTSSIQLPNASRGTSPPDDASSSADAQANTATWKTRNPGRPMVPTRASGKKLSAAEKASRELSRKSTAAKRELLANALKSFQEDNKAKIDAIARAHDVTEKYVKDLLGYQMNYHSTRKPTLKNALLHAKAKEVNGGKLLHHAMTIELREMVATDPHMQDLTPEEEAKYIQELQEFRDNRTHGVRANNEAAARDVLLTANNVAKTLDGLRDRTGIYASLFITRGHINDSVQTTWYGTDNSVVFWEDVFKHSAADVAWQYEQWACAQGQNIEERDSLGSMRKQCTAYISNGLKSLTGKRDVNMNYNNYETAIVQTYGVSLVRWPDGIVFQNPSNIGTVGDIRQLRDALRSGECHWKKLSKAEHDALTADLNTRRSAGEQVKKTRKKRSDAGTSRTSKRKEVEGTPGGGDC